MRFPLIIVIISFCLMQQAAANSFSPTRMHPDDRLIFTLFTDIWQNQPGNIDLKTIQRGVSIEALQDMPLGRSNFSIAAGLGLSSHNIYSDARYLYNPADNTFDFHSLDVDYDKNKLSINYLDIPVQFRYRTRSTVRDFRFYVGIRAGYLVNAHTKYEGIQSPGPYHIYDPEYSHMAGERKIKIKEHRLGNISKYRIGLTAMVGYGSINFSLGFPLINVFDGNSAEDMLPLSLGVSMILF